MAKTVPKPQTPKPVVRVNMPAQAATVTSLAADIAEMKLMLMQIQFAIDHIRGTNNDDFTVKREWAFYNQISSNTANIPSRWNTKWLKT